MVRISKRCERCLLSEAHGKLSNGYCQLCLTSKETSALEKTPVEVSADIKEKFDRTVKGYIDPNNQYDALVMLSGGKDSAYILHKIKNNYPALKILCLFVNNGFSSPFALKNVQYVTDKLKTDLIISNSRIDEFKAAFRKAFISLEGRGSYGVVDFTDGEMIFQTGQQVAQKLGIGLIIGGLSWVQVQMIVGTDDFQLVKEGRPRIVFPLAVWRTDEQEIRHIVKTKGLLLPGSDSPVVSNNDLILTMSAIDVLNLGYCSFEPEFAQLIREGKTDRKTWLHLFELLEYATIRGYLKKDIEANLKKLNLSLDQIVKEEQ